MHGDFEHRKSGRLEAEPRQRTHGVRRVGVGVLTAKLRHCCVQVWAHIKALLGLSSVHVKVVEV